MKTQLAAAALVLVSVSPKCLAHRLDEYLQATTIAVAKDRVEVSMRLSPGVAVAPFVLEGIDKDHDGVISDAEQAEYASRLLRDLSLSLDGSPLSLRVVSTAFAGVPMLRDGMGEMRIEYRAEIPSGYAGRRNLRFENSHLRQVSVYLVNALVPQESDVQISTQTRNFEQSSYGLEYSVGSTGAPLSGGQRWVLMGVALVVVGRVVLASAGREPAPPGASLPT